MNLTYPLHTSPAAVFVGNKTKLGYDFQFLYLRLVDVNRVAMLGARQVFFGQVAGLL